MSGGAFDELAAVFESLIDWPKRLAHEESFYRQWFERIGARSVIDVACGTGHHAAMFHSWGLRVEGADLSPNMIAQARAGFGQSDSLGWTVRSYDQPIPAQAPFDVVVCVGNSLALAPDPATAYVALGRMLAALRPGGIAVVQVLNLWAIAEGPCVWQRSRRAELPDGPALVFRAVHRCGGRGYVELLAQALADGAKLRAHAVALLGFERCDLEAAFRAGGARQVSAFGGYQGEPYDRAASGDLILVAEK